MTSELIDYESILSGNEHWSRLDEEWGTPVDLETEEEYFPPSHIHSFYSTIDLRKPTFDSASMLKNLKSSTPKVVRTSNQALNYKDFIQELDQEDKVKKEVPSKQFYFVGGQIISAVSVDEICNDIDNIFKSVEKLCATTSTVRAKKKKTKSIPKIAKIVECSISIGDLSFDETKQSVKEKSDRDLDKYIDELFQEWNETMASVHQTLEENVLDMSAKLSVTNLVQKFTSLLESPAVKCSPRRRRQCNEKFQHLADFWKVKTLERN